MTICRVESGPGLAGSLLCALAAALILLLAAGCENDAVTPLDRGDDLSKDEEIYAAIYVDGSAGDDAYDGSSLTVDGGGVGPKKTIQAGLDVTPKGKVCYVAPGTYCEQVDMADGVTLMGAGAGETVIDICRNRGYGIRIMDCNSYRTVVCGFTICRGSCYGDNGGIRIQRSSNVLVRNNVITDNLADGIRTYAASATIANNTIVRNGRNGIMACSESDLEVVNNIIADNCSQWPAGFEYGWGLYVTTSSVISSTYNDVWRHNVDYGIGTDGTCSAGKGDISISPLFFDIYGGDFRLVDGSPCIDAGVDIGLGYSGAAPDLGAFEYDE